VARLTDFADAELGAGFRLSANTLIKASVRGDRWWIQPGAAGFLGTGGEAVAVQLSQGVRRRQLVRPRPVVPGRVIVRK